MCLLSAIFSRYLEFSVGWFNFGSLLLRLLLEIILKYNYYAETKSLENKWNKQSISKLAKGKKGKNWVQAAVSELSVGDLVLLKPNTIAPADLLILYTSDKLNSEMIVSVNERKITGMNKVSIKSAICTPPESMSSLHLTIEDQNQADFTEACLMISSTSFIKDACPKLVGQIEYCSPEERVTNVFGSFKLKNDPKAIRITDENILYCGSKLLAAEVIGLVLHTGQDTKVFQQNTTQTLRTERPSRYKTILVCITMSLIMGVVSAVYKLIQPRALAVASMVTGRSKIAVCILTLIDCVIFQLHQGSPLLFMFIVELGNHFRHHSVSVEYLLKPLRCIKSGIRRCCSKDKSAVKRSPDIHLRKDSILNLKKSSEFKERAEGNSEPVENRPRREVDDC